VIPLEHTSLAPLVVALDVDGVLLDATGGGKGHWTNELSERFGLDGRALQTAFFRPYWSEVIVGTRPIEPALELALRELQWDLTVEDVLGCWFEADFEIDRDVVDAVRDWRKRGAEIVLATNQEHRRADFLRTRLHDIVPFASFLYSADLGAQKRHPAFFTAASERLGLADRARPVVLVDDDSANIDAARAHGWTGVHFSKHDGWRAEIDDALRVASAKRA
jgi:putative hydrolase of the HAD superfamily